MREYTYTKCMINGIPKGSVLSDYPNDFRTIQLAEPELGKAWREDGVRVPKKGDTFASNGIGEPMLCTDPGFTGYTPRIILKRKAEPMINQDAIKSLNEEIQRTKDLAAKVHDEAEQLKAQCEKMTGAALRQSGGVGS